MGVWRSSWRGLWLRGGLGVHQQEKPCPHLPAVPATHSNCCKLNHSCVEIQRCPLWSLQLWVTPFCSDIVRVFQFKVAVWHQASPLHNHLRALLVWLQVRNTRKKGSGISQTNVSRQPAACLSPCTAHSVAYSLCASTEQQIKQNCPPCHGGNGAEIAEI